MKKTLLNATFFCGFLLFSNTVFSQNNSWEEYFTDNNIKIEFNYQVCDFSSTASQELLVFRFTNLTKNNITLDYTTQLWNNFTEVNTELNIDEFRKTIRLEAHETLSSSCENNDMKQFTIFSSFIHNTTGEKYVTLTRFELTNITTKNE
jgi:hypothetical protein